MTHIIPVRDLKDTASISRLCHESEAPVFITKNGYGDMVMMSIKVYEDRLAKAELYAKLDAAEEQIENGEVLDARKALNRLRKRCHV